MRVDGVTVGAQRESAAGDGRDHRNLPALGDGSVKALRQPDVFVVNVDVHKPAQLARVVQQPGADTGVIGIEFPDDLAHGAGLGGDDRVRNDSDSAPFVPRSVVTNPWFEWGDDRPLRIPWHETVLYECHVKGLSMRHPEIPPELRGTYAGLAHPAAQLPPQVCDEEHPCLPFRVVFPGFTAGTVVSHGR